MSSYLEIVPARPFDFQFARKPVTRRDLPRFKKIQTESVCMRNKPKRANDSLTGPPPRVFRAKVTGGYGTEEELRLKPSQHLLVDGTGRVFGGPPGTDKSGPQGNQHLRHAAVTNGPAAASAFYGAKYPEESTINCVELEENAVMPPLIVGTIARLEVTAPSPALRVETGGCASPEGYKDR
jgi:hypothetical protein